MGNNNVGFYRHSGTLPFPCHVQLGGDATINLTTYVDQKWDDGIYTENAKISYSVEGSTCNLELSRIVDKTSRVNHVSLLFHDSIVDKLSLPIFLTDAGFFTAERKSKNSSFAWTKRKKKVDAWGGVTDTKLYLYGTANRCGLLVCECKKKNHRQDAETVTVAHYFVHSNGTGAVNRSSERTDVGFSVVVKVGVSNRTYDITVEGPERHPVSALLYMFDEVNRSGIWKPSMCPHCGNIRRNMSSWLSDSEDSDGRQRTNAGRINNGGRFNGHANGSSIRCRNFYASN